MPAGAALAGAGATTTRAHATEHASATCLPRDRTDRADARQVLAPACPDPVGVSMNRLIYNRLLTRRCARARKNVSYARSSRRLNSGFAGPTRRTSPPRSRPSRRAHKATRFLERSDSDFKFGIFASAKLTTWCRADDTAVRRRAAGSEPDRRQAAQPPGLLPCGDSARSQEHVWEGAHQHTPG